MVFTKHKMFAPAVLTHLPVSLLSLPNPGSRYNQPRRLAHSRQRRENEAQRRRHPA